MYHKIKNYFNNQLGNFYLFEILFVFSMGYYFGYAFFGLDFTDTFFHLNNARRANSDINFLIVLSALIIKFFLNFVTENVLFLRIINGVIKISPLFIYLYYFKIPKRSFLIWTFIILIILTPNNSFVLGYDSLSVFTLTLILLILIKSKSNFNYSIIFLLSILSSCAILIRFPNILLVGIVFLCILFSDAKWNLFSTDKIPKAFFYLITTLSTCILFYYLIYGSVGSFLNSNYVEVKSKGHHGIINLLYYYIRDFGKIMFFSVEIFFFLYLFLKIRINKAAKIVYLIIPVVVFHLIFLYKYVLISRYSYNFSLYVSALMVVFVIHNLFFNKVQKNEKIVIMILFLSFLFVEPFGSNTGLLKVAPLLIIFPFVYQFSELATKKLYLVLLITILPFAILEKANSIYEDSKLVQLRYTTNTKFIQGINTTFQRARFVNLIDSEYKKLTHDNYAVFFYGNKSQIFNYLYPSFDLNIKDFHQPINDLLYLNQISNVAKNYKKVAIFIVNDYPSLNIDNHDSVLEKELLKNDFKPVFKNSIVYYIN